MSLGLGSSEHPVLGTTPTGQLQTALQPRDPSFTDRKTLRCAPAVEQTHVVFAQKGTNGEEQGHPEPHATCDHSSRTQPQEVGQTCAGDSRKGRDEQSQGPLALPVTPARATGGSAGWPATPVSWSEC